MGKIKFMRLFCMELKKATHNKMFIGTMAITCFFAITAALYQMGSYEDVWKDMKSIGGFRQEISLYSKWMSIERSSMGAICFYYLLPLLAAFPYGWGYLAEKQSGYYKSLIVIGGKTFYYINKYLVTFLVGGMVILIPQIINFVMIATVIPAQLPNIHFFPYYGIMEGDIWANLFYSKPLLYVFLYFILDFIFAGLFACISLACSMLIENKIAVLLIPYFLVLLLHYGKAVTYYKVYYELSPLNFLGAKAPENTACWWIILLEGIIFFVLSASVTAITAWKKELI